MKKVLFLALIPLLLIGCKNLNTDKAQSGYTITINSDSGQTVISVDEETGNMTRSIYTDAESNTVTDRVYSYDGSNNLRSVYVEDSQQGAYTLDYGEVESNTARSLIQENDSTPAKIQKITRTFASKDRALKSSENKEPDTIEYQYDDDGNLTAIYRIDDKNNVICKGAE